MSEENITGIVQTYVQAWNETDEATRRKLLEVAWGDDAQYTDPTAQVRGRNELVLHIGHLLQRWPSMRLEMSSGIDLHHQTLRFRWHILRPDGTVSLEGMDFGELGCDGRLQRIVGFFGPFPQSS